MEPVLSGIQSLSQGKEFHLEEKGELAEINAGLNRAGEYLMKKDNTRAECCLFEISDTGCGIATPQLSLLNGGMPISSTQEENNVTKHGLIVKISLPLK